jgi:uncharacterized protein (DUF58 family)
VNLYPTRRAIALAASGAPVALLVAALAPGLWTLAGAWVLIALGLLLVDAWLAAPVSALTLEVRAPELIGLQRPATLAIEARFAGAAPRVLELAAGADERLQLAPERRTLAVSNGRAATELSLAGLRRGPGQLTGVWARWSGPLGLVWRQRVLRPDAPVLVTPDLEGVREGVIKLFSRDAAAGVKTQLELGEGTEFHALKEFQTGMDRRAIDWKQSARHGKLVAREFRLERNHTIVLALDTGRLMSAPVGSGSRVDRAITSALQLAFVGLKLGDRVALFAFDSKPRVSSGAVAGAGAFRSLQTLAAEIDYSAEETNFTLGVSSLAARLDHRALVVVFTDFADATSAELMLERVGHLTRTHLVLLVTFRDEELERLAETQPQTPEHVSRAVVAHALMRQRQGVLTRLRRQGVQILEARADELGPGLLDRYLDIKRRELV